MVGGGGNYLSTPLRSCLQLIMIQAQYTQVILDSSVCTYTWYAYPLNEKYQDNYNIIPIIQ